MSAETPRYTEKESPRNFMTLLKERWVSANTLLCVGLDSEYAKLPEAIRGEFPSNAKGSAVFEFNRQIIDATHDLVCAYKPQFAFYGAITRDGGVVALIDTIAYIHEKYPEIPVILDGKRNDIGNTAEQYAAEVFDEYGADAATVTPYLGIDGVKPFLGKPDKGVIVLCRTSNNSASDFQNLIDRESGLPIYQVVAKKAKEWNYNGNIGLVMGATGPEEMMVVRKLVGGEIPFLVPGLGAQGGKPEDLPNGFDGQRAGIIANSSRGIIFASSGDDFAEAARREALKLRDAINAYR